MRRWMCAALGLDASILALLHLRSLSLPQPILTSTDVAVVAVALVIILFSAAGLSSGSGRALMLTLIAAIAEVALLITSRLWMQSATLLIVAAIAGYVLLAKKGEPPGPRRISKALRTLAAVLLVVAAILVVVRMSLLRGFFVPVRIVGASMAPALHGNQFETICRDCRFPILFDAENPETQLTRIVCPNCGYPSAPERNSLEAKRGETVLLDRASNLLDSPQRWTVIASRSPDDLVTKRVIALPKEEIAIRYGEVFINGFWNRKTLAQCRSVAQLVHDSAYKPRSKNLPDRWTFEKTNDSWSATFHSWRCFDTPRPRTEEFPITDHDAYNQGNPRDVNFVRDLLLSADLTITGDGAFTFVLNDEREEKEAGVDFSRGTIWVSSAGEVQAEQTLEPARLRRCLGRGVWEFAAIDGQLMLAHDGAVLISAIADQHVNRSSPGGRPLSMRAKDLHIAANRLRVYRDIFYLSPNGLNIPWNGPKLAADEYFLVGDNVPISRDSRLWGPVKRADVLGTVVVRE